MVDRYRRGRCEDIRLKQYLAIHDLADSGEEVIKTQKIAGRYAYGEAT